MGYSNYQKLESKIEQLLQGTAKDEWSTIKGTVKPDTNTIETFNLRIKAFKKYIFQNLQRLKIRSLTYFVSAKMIDS